VMSVLMREASPLFPEARIITLDGLRLEFADGWALIRASNTQPVLVTRFEAVSVASLERIALCVREAILGVIAHMPHGKRHVGGGIVS
jgi:phosphomannomutase